MSQLNNFPYNFQDGVGPAFVASGVKVMANFEALRAVVNSLDADNVDNASGIVTMSRDAVITGAWTFNENPVFGEHAINDSALSSNVALKENAGTFSAKQTFAGGIDLGLAPENLKVPVLSAHPSVVGDNDKIYRYSGDNCLYVYKHGTGAVRLDYVGDYTGGALRSYNGMLVIDENSPGILMFKCDTGFTSAKIALKGFNFPEYMYTELAAHSHGTGTFALADGSVVGLAHVHTVSVPSHTHVGTFASGSHTHAFSDTSSAVDLAHTHTGGDLQTGTSGGHDHGGATGGTLVNQSEPVSSHTHVINIDGGHAHTTISGHTGSQLSLHTHNISGQTGSPSGTASVNSVTIGDLESLGAVFGGTPAVGTALTGSSEIVGVQGATVNVIKKSIVTSAIKLYISNSPANWGVALDSGVLAGLTNINTDLGTGELDITGYCVDGLNYIKVIDETANTGGSVAYLIETS